MTSPYNQQLGDPTQAARFDDGKVRLELVPAEAVEAMGRVFTHGSQKYDDWNWAKGFPWLQPYASLMRHLMAWHRGEDTDTESGLPHLDHAITNLAMLITFRERGIGDDTRYRYPNARTLIGVGNESDFSKPYTVTSEAKVIDENRDLVSHLFHAGECERADKQTAAARASIIEYMEQSYHAVEQGSLQHGPEYKQGGIVGSQPCKFDLKGTPCVGISPPEIDYDQEDEVLDSPEWGSRELIPGEPLSFKAAVPNPLRARGEGAIEGQPLLFTIEVQLPAPTDDGFLWCELPSSVRTRSHVLARVQALREDGYCNRVIRVHRVAERLVRDESEDVDGFGGSGWIQEGTITRLERIIFPGDGRVYP